MPSHPDRVASAGLSAGYQFGDARHEDWFMTPQSLEELRAAMYGPDWRPLHANAADHIKARQVAAALNDPDHWNVIEGDR